MARRTRIAVRAGIVASWAILLGTATVLGAAALLDGVGPVFETSQTVAIGGSGSSLFCEIGSALVGSGATSALLGLGLVLIGWYQLLRLG